MAARMVAALEAGLIVRVVDIFLCKPRVSMLAYLLVGLFLQTTFFHLAFIAVFVFVEPLLELVLSLSLQESDPIFVQ